MPSTNNQALLLDLQVFLATNNIRRGVLSVAINAATESNNFVEQTIDVAASGTKTYTCLTGNVCTVIRTSIPINVVVTKGIATFSFTINSLFVFTDSIDQILFTNPDATNIATLRLVQI